MLAVSLFENDTLTNLDLSYNSVTPSAALVLAFALKVHTLWLRPHVVYDTKLPSIVIAGMSGQGQRANTIVSVLISHIRRYFVSDDMSVISSVLHYEYQIQSLRRKCFIQRRFEPHVYMPWSRLGSWLTRTIFLSVPWDTQVNTTVNFVELEGNRIGQNGGEVCVLLQIIVSQVIRLSCNTSRKAPQHSLSRIYVVFIL